MSHHAWPTFSYVFKNILERRKYFGAKIERRAIEEKIKAPEK
jgi:hypothetical protein